MKLYRALYDVGFYVEALKEKTGKAIRFAILLGLFFGSLSMIPSVVEINRTIDSIILDMENRLPAFTIQEGVLVSSSDAPYALNMAGLAVVVDPRASETGLQADADFGFYFTKDRMSIRNAISKTAPIKYANLVRDAFGKEELVALIATMKLGGWLLPKRWPAWKKSMWKPTTGSSLLQFLVRSANKASWIPIIRWTVIRQFVSTSPVTARKAGFAYLRSTGAGPAPWNIRFQPIVCPDFTVRIVQVNCRVSPIARSAVPPWPPCRSARAVPGRCAQGRGAKAIY